MGLDIGSLVAFGTTGVIFTVAEVVILKVYGVGSDAYKNIIEFSKNNKNISEFKNAFENVEKKIDDITKRLSYLKNRLDEEYISMDDLREIYKEIEAIKSLNNRENLSNKLDLFKQELDMVTADKGKNDASLKDLETCVTKVNAKLEDLSKKITKLESSIKNAESSYTAPPIDNNKLQELYNKINGLENKFFAFLDSQHNQQDLQFLNSKIDELYSSLDNKNTDRTMMYSNIQALESKMGEFDSYIKNIGELCKDIAKSNSLLKTQNITLNAKIDECNKKNEDLEKKYSALYSDIAKLKEENKKLNEKIEQLSKGKSEEPQTPKLPHQPCITVDEKYVEDLSKRFNAISENLPKNIVRDFNKAIADIDEDDYDDSAELAKITNHIIDKYIMNRFNNVKPDVIPLFEKYITDAGYIRMNIKENDSIKTYSKYFSQAYPEKTTDPALDRKIKKIYRMPYISHFYDDYLKKYDEISLGGECSYYELSK